MTQAGLSPDLSGATPTVDSTEWSGRTSESSLWVTTLTATSLLLAAVLLLGLLTRNAVTDTSYRAFVSGASIMIAAFGVGALAFVLVTARRQGLLGWAGASAPAPTPVAPSGMHVVPALPAEMGRRRRQQLQLERSARGKQAQAIVTAATSVAKRRSIAPPASPSVTSLSARPTASPARSTRPAVRMPRPPLRQPRPAAWPARAPVVRMATPPVVARTSAVLHQVNAASVRMQAPAFRR